MAKFRSPDDEESATWANANPMERALRLNEYAKFLEEEIARVAELKKEYMKNAYENNITAPGWVVACRNKGGIAYTPDVTMFEAEYPKEYAQWKADKIAAYVPKLLKGDLDAYFPVLGEDGAPMKASRSKAYIEAKKTRDAGLLKIMIQEQKEPVYQLMEALE